jgi:hypothetical protein
MNPAAVGFVLGSAARFSTRINCRRLCSFSVSRFSTLKIEVQVNLSKLAIINKHVMRTTTLIGVFDYCVFPKLDVRGSVHHSKIHEEKSNKMQQCIRILLFHVYVKPNTFRATHRPSSEPKTALATSGFSYVEGCWMCSWWTLKGCA